MTSHHSRSIRIAVATLALVALAACGKVTAENYAKLKVGMTYQETTAVLGSPAKCDDTAGFKVCRWEDGKAVITARFAADKMVLHSADNIR